VTAVRRSCLGAAALVTACALLAGCGSSNNRLSASQYKGRLATISHRADATEESLEKALTATTVAQIETRLQTFVTADQRLGRDVAALDPPTNAVAANAELARGESDTADEVRAMLPRLTGIKNVKAALALLNKHLNGARGPSEIDRALGRLKQEGYARET
jgi:hypothetical protein